MKLSEYYCSILNQDRSNHFKERNYYEKVIINYFFAYDARCSFVC